KSHFELGKFYHEIGNSRLALSSLMEALKLAEENGLFYLTPYIEDEMFRTHEAKWKDIVNKRTKHERVFDKTHSLLEALTELMDSHEEEAQPSGGSESGHRIPFLVSLLKVGQAMAAERDLDKLLQLIKDETER